LRTDQNIRGSSRLSSDERRQAIIEAVKEVFAEKGFDGTITVPAVDYKVPKETLIEQAVHFALRGIGLTDETIKRYYNPK